MQKPSWAVEPDEQEKPGRPSWAVEPDEPASRIAPPFSTAGAAGRHVLDWVRQLPTAGRVTPGELNSGLAAIGGGVMRNLSGLEEWIQGGREGYLRKAADWFDRSNDASRQRTASILDETGHTKGVITGSLLGRALPYMLGGAASGSARAGTAVSAALTAAAASGRRDESMAGMMADMTDDEGLTRHWETVADSPTGRAALDVAFDVGTGALFGGLRQAKPRKLAEPPFVPRETPETNPARMLPGPTTQAAPIDPVAGRPLGSHPGIINNGGPSAPPSSPFAEGVPTSGKAPRSSRKQRELVESINASARKLESELASKRALPREDPDASAALEGIAGARRNAESLKTSPILDQYGNRAGIGAIEGITSLTGAGIGGLGGYAYGDTPGERAAYAGAGAILGAGIGAAAPTVLGKALDMAITPGRKTPTDMPMLRARRGAVGERYNVEPSGSAATRDGSFADILNSRVEKAIAEAPFERGTPQQWLAEVRKNTPEFERDWLGIEMWLANNPKGSLSRKDVHQFFKENRIVLKQEYKNKFDSYWPKAEGTVEAIDAYQHPDNYVDWSPGTHLEWGYSYLSDYDELVEKLNLRLAEAQAMAGTDAPIVSNIRDTIVEALDERARAYRVNGLDPSTRNIMHEMLVAVGEAPKGEYIESILSLDRDYAAAKFGGRPGKLRYKNGGIPASVHDFDGGHFDVPNTVLHTRMQVTHAVDPQTGFVEPALYWGESQSDWAQNARGRFSRSEAWDDPTGFAEAYGDAANPTLMPLPERWYAKGDETKAAQRETLKTLNEIVVVEPPSKNVDKLLGDAEGDIAKQFDIMLEHRNRHLAWRDAEVRWSSAETYPPTPFDKTPAWTELSFKNAIYEAAKRNIRRIILPNWEQAAIGAGQDVAGHSPFASIANRYEHGFQTPYLAWRLNGDGSVMLRDIENPGVLQRHFAMSPNMFVHAQDVDDVANYVFLSTKEGVAPEPGKQVSASLKRRIAAGERVGIISEKEVLSENPGINMENAKLILADQFGELTEGIRRKYGMGSTAIEGIRKYYSEIVPRIVRDYLKVIGQSFDKIPAEMVPRLEYGPNNLTITFPEKFMRDVMNPKIGLRLGIGAPEAVGSIAGGGLGAAGGGYVGSQFGDTEEERSRNAALGAALGGVVGGVGGNALMRGLSRSGNTGGGVPPRNPSATPTAQSGGAGQTPYAKAVAQQTAGPLNLAADRLTKGVKKSLSRRNARAVEQALRGQGVAKQVVSDEAMARFAAVIPVDDIDPARVASLDNSEMLAIANRAKALDGEVKRLSKELALAPPEAQDAIAAKFDDAFRNLVSLAGLTSGAKSERGRGLRLAAKLAAGSVEQAIGVARRVLGVKSLSPELVDEFRRILLDSSLTTDRAREAAMAKAIHKAARLPWWQAVLGVRRVGLLSAPVTWSVNTLGNVSETGAKNLIVTPMAAAFDRVWSKATGQQPVFDLGARASGLAKGARRGAREAIDQARQVLVEGKSVSDMTETGYGELFRNQVDYVRDLPMLPQAVTKKLQGMSDVVFMAMDAADRPFYEASFEAGLRERVTLRGRGAGLSGKSLDDFVAKSMTREVDGSMPFIAQEDFIGAQFEALDDTFKSPTALGKALRSLESPLGKILAGWLIPFEKTPSNLIRKGFESVPGVGALVYRAHRGKLEKLLVQAGVPKEAIAREFRRGTMMNNARMTLGAAMMFLGYKLSEAGALTGEYVPSPARDDEDTQDANRRTLLNQPPLTVRIGNKAYSLAGLAQFAPLLAFGRAIHTAVREERQDPSANLLERASNVVGKSVLRGASSAGRTVAQFPMLSGVKNLSDILQGEESLGAGALAGREVSTLVPGSSLWATVARARDPIAKRKAETFSEAIMERLPLLREQLPATVGAMGEVTPRAGVINALANPFRPQVTNAGPLYDALDEIGMYPTTPNRLSAETDEQYGRRLERDGAMAAPRRMRDETYAEYSARRQMEGPVERNVLQAVLDGDPEAWALGVSPATRERFAETGDWKTPLSAALAAVRREHTRERNIRRQ